LYLAPEIQLKIVTSQHFLKNKLFILCYFCKKHAHMNTVVIGELANNLTKFIADGKYSNLIILVDEKTKKYCYPFVKNLLGKHSLIQIKSGEGNKNLYSCQTIWTAMTAANLDRHSLMVNLGGGVIGDMGGFCAATYKRGIDFVQIPTTLLSQVDASVGGKLGIDFESFKNHIGVFKVPNSVMIDPVFLQTLPKSELRSGFAEIIKHCLIRDEKKWQEISKNDLENQNWEDLIRHSVSIKMKVTEEDPTEKNIRKILNFGHTLGHAIETYFLGSKNHLLHGEAIAVGMICESFIAFKKKMISKEQLINIEEFIFSIYGSVKIKEADFQNIIKLTAQDKKNRGNEIRFSLINGIGDCLFDIPVSKNEMVAALKYYCGN
jgi:3-dehydroquinate synthase